MELKFVDFLEEIKVKITDDSDKIILLSHRLREYFTHVITIPGSERHFVPIEMLMLLAIFKKYFTRNSEWECIIAKNLNLLQQDLQASIFHPYSIESGYAHASFALYKISKQLPNVVSFHQAVHVILLENITENLCEYYKSKNFFIKNNFELLYGLSGSLRYLLDYNDNESNKVTQKIVEFLIKRAKDEHLLGHIVPGYHYIPSEEETRIMSETPHYGLINYGLAHGMAAPLVVLSMAYAKNVQVDGLIDTINKLLNLYLHSAYYVDGIAYWPTKIFIEQFVGIEEIPKISNRQSWCYGSIGILRALFLSSKYTNNKEIEDFSITELKKIAQLETVRYGLSSPIICHGFAGTVSILHEMYKDTGDEVFLREATKQAKFCIEHFINANFDYVEPEYSKRVYLISYLEGYSGILQTLFSFLFDDDCYHKKQILVV